MLQQNRNAYSLVALRPQLQLKPFSSLCGLVKYEHTNLSFDIFEDLVSLV
jgi:hypothetical protein